MNFIIFDLEATCWEKSKGKVSEIIEIGAVKLNEQLETIDFFSSFIKPTLNPILSDFCTNLTSISQASVDTAEKFTEVMNAFEQWIILTEPDVLLCSWGFYDKKQILQECFLKNYTGFILKLLDNHISLKHQFSEVKKIRLCGMANALRILNLSLEGTHHRGIDDAKNISKIFKAIYPELSSRNVFVDG
jgi:inhibitor of KinA sporulation pathway (predicted exonuclease)